MDWFERSLQRAKERATPLKAPRAPEETPTAEEAVRTEGVDEKPAKRSRRRKA